MSIAGTNTSMSFVFNWNPARNRYNLGVSAAAADVTMGAAVTPFTGGIFSASDATNLAQSFRCAAACAKFIPLGPVASRSGLIGGAYVGDKVATDSEVVVVGDALTMCPVVSTNGADMMEVKWFPADPSDLEFRPATTTTADTGPDSGTILLVGRGVDATGTPSFLQGQIELTAVYEWIPNIKQGTTPTLMPPPSYTLNQVLRSIGDLARAAIATHGPGAANLAMHYMSRKLGAPMGTQLSLRDL